MHASEDFELNLHFAEWNERRRRALRMRHSDRRSPQPYGATSSSFRTPKITRFTHSPAPWPVLGSLTCDARDSRRQLKWPIKFVPREEVGESESEEGGGDVKASGLEIALETRAPSLRIFGRVLVAVLLLSSSSSTPILRSHASFFPSTTTSCPALVAVVVVVVHHTRYTSEAPRREQPSPSSVVTAIVVVVVIDDAGCHLSPQVSCIRTPRHTLPDYHHQARRRHSRGTMTLVVLHPHSHMSPSSVLVLRVRCCRWGIVDDVRLCMQSSRSEERFSAVMPSIRAMRRVDSGGVDWIRSLILLSLFVV
ncbi:hypothetical protein DFP72DRAFT_1048249 [Ephemerocybe angulata]|uniref:Uncharacterized protein n=1 Tax=Ephemerocybe angulata TaxID=980116 RepID=A0A8H6HS04_9AGAR|nr:hypothetical protein DFP72DRAFT_1048249 [Tulosesus angulatus]